MAELREGFNRLTQLIVGANTLVQGAIPHILCPAAGSSDAVSLAADNAHYCGTLEANAAFTHERLSRVVGLRPVRPQGAMYVMVGYDPQVCMHAISHVSSSYACNLPACTSDATAVTHSMHSILAPSDPQRAGLLAQVLTDIRDDADFTDKLLSEEAVFVLPGQCFGVTHFFRVVFSGPRDKLADAFDRIEGFCKRHALPPPMQGP